MQRRALLVGLGSVLAGCMGPQGGGSTTTSPPPSSPDPGSEMQISTLSVDTSTAGPDSRYVLKTAAFYSEAAVERERRSSAEPVIVRDVSSIVDADARRVIEEAIRTDEWRGDSIPAGVPKLVEEVDFFTGVGSDDTYTHIGLELYELDPEKPPAIEFDATITDEWIAEGDPGAIDFSLRNTSQQTQEIFSGTVPPFGLLKAERTDDADSFLLWRDYEAEGCVTFTDDGLAVCAIGVITHIEPGESLSRQYEVLPPSTNIHPGHTAPPGAGRYRMREKLSYSRGDMEPGSTLTTEVTFELQRL